MFLELFLLQNFITIYFLKVKNIEKNAPKRTKLHHSKFFFGEACPRTPLANAWLRHASQASQKVGPPWQILHTPMDNY